MLGHPLAGRTGLRGCTPAGLAGGGGSGPGSRLLAVVGAISLGEVRAEAVRLGPVMAFLAAVLVLAQLCDDEGLFRAWGADGPTCAGRPRRLLLEVFGVASIVTAVLSLDATVVLLTPVVFATPRRLGTRPKPHVYACTHLSNTASLLLPVSNLTNLLAFAASGLSFTRFAGADGGALAGRNGAEYLVFRRFFATDLTAGAGRRPPDDRRCRCSRSVTVACTLAGFVVASASGVEPAWAAAAGAAVLAVRALARRRTRPGELCERRRPCRSWRSCWPSASSSGRSVDNGLAAALAHLVPDGTGLPALLAIAALAAVLANLINNLPAVLVLLPLAAPAGPAPCWPCCSG